MIAKFIRVPPHNYGAKLLQIRQVLRYARTFGYKTANIVVGASNIAIERAGYVIDKFGQTVEVLICLGKLVASVYSSWPLNLSGEGHDRYDRLNYSNSRYITIPLPQGAAAYICTFVQKRIT